MRIIILFLSLVLTTFFDSACVSGPKRENDTVLDRLNGHNYEANPSAPFIVKRLAPMRVISGVLLIDTQLGGEDTHPLAEPFRYQTLALLKNDHEFLRTMSNSLGEFTFEGDIQNGIYTIVVMSERHSTSQKISVSHYKTTDLRIVVPAPL